MKLISAALTHPGQKRTHNEDFITFFEPLDKADINDSGNLYIVADGVGGASKGERASQYAAQKVQFEYYRNPNDSPEIRLAELLQLVGNDINTFAEESPQFMRMATTMVAAVVRNNYLTVANVGDSRAYLIRDGIANQITRDHSFVSEMVRDGVMTEEEARVSKKKNRITRSLGGERDVRVDIFDDISLTEGDKILLCSDGFSQYANRKTVAALVAEGTPDEIVARLIAHANKNGGSDNISVILFEMVPDHLAVPLAGEGAAGDLPKDVDWDTISTNPGLTLKVANKNRKRNLILASIISGTVIGLLLIVGNLLLTNTPTTQVPTSIQTHLPTVTHASNSGDNYSAQITVEDVTGIEGNDLLFTVTLDNAVQGAFTVALTLTDVSATAGEDYNTAVATRVFAGTAGETHEFIVAILDDEMPETTETFTVSLDADDSLINDSDTATGTITDNNSAQITVEDVTVTEGSDLLFTVTLDNAVQSAFNVAHTLTDVSAIDGEDYFETTVVTLAFAGTAGETHEFTVGSFDDAEVENTETFTVSLEADDPLIGDSDTAFGTITDNDTVQVTDNITCNYKFNDIGGNNGTWLTYEREFGLTTYKYDNFFVSYAFNISCVDVNPEKCKYISGDEWVPPGSFLAFPDIPRDSCIAAGGTPSQ